MKILNILSEKHRPLAVIAISLIFILVIIVGMFIVFDNNNSQTNSDINSQSTESIDSAATLSGDSCFLVVCNSEKIGDAIFMALVDFKIFASDIVLTVLDQSTVSDSKSYAESYAYGGINDLVSAVENVRKCDIDRYVIIDKDGLNKITDIMGKITLNISESYTYESSDNSYSVDAGYNDLEGAMFYSYLKINAEKSNGVQRVADLLSTAINQYLADIDKSDAQDLFERLSNCFKSNITIADYYSSKPDIEHLLSHNAECVIFSEGA